MIVEPQPAMLSHASASTKNGETKREGAGVTDDITGHFADPECLPSDFIFWRKINKSLSSVSHQISITSTSRQFLRQSDTGMSYIGGHMHTHLLTHTDYKNRWT